MNESPAIRVPKQKRSIQKKQHIVNTAKILYAQNGYHNTTTNEIAKQAKVSIGTLYSYFPDKEEILLEILKQLGAQYFPSFDFLSAQEDRALFRDDPREWLQKMMDSLVGLLESQKELYREIASLRYSVTGVAAALDAQDERIRLGILALLTAYQEQVTCADIQAASVILAKFSGTLAELIVFCESAADKRRLMNEGIEALYKAIRG